jgi:hypothetical protein
LGFDLGVEHAARWQTSGFLSRVREISPNYGEDPLNIDRRFWPAAAIT